MSDADCMHAFCGWTGPVYECDTSARGPLCPECGGEVKVFDGPSLTGMSEFAITSSCGDCGSSEGEHRGGCPQIDPADLSAQPQGAPRD